MGLKVKRWSVQWPLEEGLPFIVTLFLTRDEKSYYKVGVGMTPEAAVRDIAEKTSFWAGVLLEDWHPFLRQVMLYDAASGLSLPKDIESHDDIPF